MAQQTPPPCCHVAKGQKQQFQTTKNLTFDPPTRLPELTQN